LHGLQSLLLMAGAGLAPSAVGGDFFGTAAEVPKGPASPLLGDAGDPCGQIPRAAVLTLFEAVERNLCESPKTRSAWAAVKVAAAAVGESKAAYLPTLDASLEYSEQHSGTSASDPGLSSNTTQAVNSESLSLSWVLYDFGGRSATLKNSRQLLLAAKANQNMILQAAFASTAKDYYATQAANAKVQSTRRIESGTQQILTAATARYGTGVSPITDQFEANTAFAQAVYERAKAEGDYQVALGTLAVDMSLPPDAPLNMPDMDQTVAPDSQFVQSVHDLIAAAAATHPTVLAAKAQWQAALDNVRVVRAEGLPKVSLVAEATHSNQPLSSSLGVPTVAGSSRDELVGLSVAIPLFEGFEREYKIRAAQAQAETLEQALRDAQQQVSATVWLSFQTLQSATANVRNTEEVLKSARQSFDASLHRYQSGVGNILDLLSVQKTLATAEEQQIEAQLDWRTARLQLAASLGQLQMSAIQ
jgi:outer membrane protein